ncbi:unnamed protein product [Rotaria sp. Silwood2]|nr:unnamed protein product [Rotaria sp. Silwood2]
MIVFSSRTFRNRAYSVYLLSEAMSDFIYFDFVLITRILQKGFQIPITIRYDVLCKLRQFVSVWGNQVSFTLFSFATIDRLLSAQRSNIVVTGICPPIVMILLAYLLIRSVRGVIQRRIVPDNNGPSVTLAHRSVLQNMDSRLTLMLILQSIIAIITYIPYASELIYSNVTQYWSKSDLRNAQEKVFVELTHLLSYIFFATSFYVSLISNDGFRRQFKNFFQKPKSDDRTIHINTIFHTNTIINIQQK